MRVERVDEDEVLDAVFSLLLTPLRRSPVPMRYAHCAWLS